MNEKFQDLDHMNSFHLISKTKVKFNQVMVLDQNLPIKEAQHRVQVNTKKKFKISQK